MVKIKKNKLVEYVEFHNKFLLNKKIYLIPNN
jgi:hypothetical protein